MKPFTLDAGVVLLDEVRASDTLAIYEYCQDPVFEQFLTTPWPYRRQHAEAFVNEFVPEGWRTGEELTWALRRHEGAPLLGVIGLRLREMPQLGFWLGAENRGHGYMPRAVTAVVDWAFGAGVETVQWECLVPNAASLAVARKTGFTFDGMASATVVSRDGSRPPTWTGLLHATDSREPKPGWPA
ncbi:GNAT family N-acetyltransferase [soil metagenome]